LTYFVVYEAYFVVCGFCRNIRDVSAYFVVYALSLLFMISCRNLSGHESASPLRACVKVDDYLIHFLQVH
jgi:hypothetical protein